MNQLQHQNQKDQADGSQTNAIPPILRSILTQMSDINGNVTTMMMANPGMHNGVIYKKVPWAYATGWRDASRGSVISDKGNHIRLRDPLCSHGFTVPAATAQTLWHLHEDKVMNIEADLKTFLPELPDHFEMLTPRDILSYSCDLDETAVLATMNIKKPSAKIPGYAETYRAQVHEPIRKLFGEKQGLSPMECRGNVVRHLVDNSGRIPRVKRAMKASNRVAPCHFGFALLAAAVDRATGKPFEDVVYERLFGPQELKSAGFGTPKVIAKSDTFFQPQSGSNCHDSWASIRVLKKGKSIPFSDQAQAGPSVFNASMNMFADAKDLGALLTLSPMVVSELEQKLGKTPEAKRQTFYHELGVAIHGNSGQHSLVNPLWPSSPNFAPLPWSYSYSYDPDHELGSFSLGNCGGFAARLAVMTHCRTNAKLMMEQIVKDNIDVFDDEGNKEAMDKLNKRKQAGLYKMFMSSDSHTKL